MKKSDLISGDIVLTRNGAKHIVLKDTKHFGGSKDLIIDLSNGCYLTLEDYNNDLKYSDSDSGSEWDIIKVCSHRYSGDNIRDHIIDDRDNWTWKRQDVKEMTVDEISKALGYEVKVVGEDR